MRQRSHTRFFVIVIRIDGEHGPFGLDQLEDLCRTAERHNVTTIARVPDIGSSTILRYLDRGHIGPTHRHGGPEATIAYETYGRLAPDGRNAILCTHGYTGSHHFAGRNRANGNQPGSWDGLIGPGRAIDTDKLFVVRECRLLQSR